MSLQGYDKIYIKKQFMSNRHNIERSKWGKWLMEKSEDRKNENTIGETVASQKDFFMTHTTLDVNYRIAYLKKLKETIISYEARILGALKMDLGKSEQEAYMSEVGLTLSELNYQLRHIAKWSKRKKCKTAYTNMIGKSFSIREPYGVVLVMAPWNYPFMLSLEPLIGAIAAGNCCVLKPSAYAKATSQVLADIIKEVFPPEYVAVVQGGRVENAALLEQRFDYIFFTGGVSVGKLVMEKAAAHLTPVTLELGGKSPCIVEKSANLAMAARRIAFGKYLNCGQTCVAPDYLLIDESIRDEFVELFVEEIKKMYSENPFENADYGKIVNEKHFERLKGLICSQKVVYGGSSKKETLQIEPTVMVDVTAQDTIMQEEIFGPILPVLTYHTIGEAENFVASREKPLALYLFTENKEVEKRFLEQVSFGGGCVNDTIVHIASSEIGFGGVGNSGMGSYHGRKSFETFTHEKSILKKSTNFDVQIRYQPYNKGETKLLKEIFK